MAIDTAGNRVLPGEYGPALTLKKRYDNFIGAPGCRHPATNITST